jgi:ABC-2 type transport system permease protein
VKAAGFALLGLLFLSGIHWSFYRFLTVIRNVEMIGDLLLIKILAMAFMTGFLMIVFSSTIASFSTLFFARDLSMLVHTPLSYRTLFGFKSLETAVFASWIMVLVLVPFLAAYGRVLGQGAIFYVAAGVLIFPFAGLASAVGIGLSLLLMRLFPARRVREAMLVLAVVMGTGLFLWVRWLAPAQFLRADTLDFVIQYISLLKAPTAPYLAFLLVGPGPGPIRPGKRNGGRPIRGVVAGRVRGGGRGSVVGGGTRLLHGLGFGPGSRSTGKSSSPVGNEWRWIPPIVGPRFRAYLGKDLAIFRRDSNQWSQLLMLVSIVAIYLISIRKLPLDTAFLKALVSFLNIGMVGFVLASVALRFVFPAVSVEGKSWWALRASPMSLWEILWGKFLSGVVPIAVMGGTLVWVSNIFLGVDTFVVRLSNITVLAMAVTLSAMGVGFGALFPRFEMENVAQIQTSPGGLLFMVTALFYVGATLALEAVLMRGHYFSGQGFIRSDESLYAMAALAALNVAAFTIPLLLGKSNLDRADL